MSNENSIEDITSILDRSIDEKVKDFDSLLNQIESLSDKKRQLWKEIYENAISDRQNSYAMFVRLVKIVQDKSTEHAVHGRTISAYIERMSKANDQLIRLAELIAKAEKSDEEINPDDMFDRIKRGGLCHQDMKKLINILQREMPKEYSGIGQRIFKANILFDLSFIDTSF